MQQLTKHDGRMFEQGTSKDKTRINNNAEDFQLRGRVGEIRVPRQLEFLQRQRKDTTSKRQEDIYERIKTSMVELLEKQHGWPRRSARLATV